MSDYETLLVEDRGAVRLVTIHRPDALNALNEIVIAELSRVFHQVQEDAPAKVRAVVLTGAGKAFVAGADIKAMAEMGEADARAFASAGHAVGEMIAALPVPVLAAVNGFALGGGCELALACDFIYASSKAKFGQPEVNLGVIPGFGGTQRLARRVGVARCMELCLTGEMIRADEALRIGLANKVFEPEELVEAALKVGETIASKGPLAVAKAKQVIHRGADEPLPAANALEVEAFAALFETADQKEGMKAFMDKRNPAFKGE